MNETDDLIAALRPVAEAFGALGVRFYVGGSVASSFHGAVRSTMDVDLVCELDADRIERFIGALGEDFYASRGAIEDAVRRKSCFNLIHLPTSYKVDVFISRGRPFDRSSMDRAALRTLGESCTISVRVCSVEDSIISKLDWFRLTDQTSQRQWDDVVRLVDLAGDSLETAYLREAADSVGVLDLLDRLLRHDAG